MTLLVREKIECGVGRRVVRLAGATHGDGHRTAVDLARTRNRKTMGSTEFGGPGTTEIGDGETVHEIVRGSTRGMDEGLDGGFGGEAEGCGVLWEAYAVVSGHDRHDAGLGENCGQPGVSRPAKENDVTEVTSVFAEGPGGDVRPKVTGTAGDDQRPARLRRRRGSGRGRYHLAVAPDVG